MSIPMLAIGSILPDMSLWKNQKLPPEDVDRLEIMSSIGGQGTVATPVGVGV